MSRNDIIQRVRQRPFHPFILVSSEGGLYPVTHPDFIMVGRSSVTIGLTGGQVQEFYETTVLIDLRHVVRLEPLGAPAPASDGTGSA